MVVLKDVHLHSECHEVFSSIFGVSLQCALNHIWLIRSSSNAALLNNTSAMLSAQSRLKLFTPTHPSIFLPPSKLNFYGSSQLNSTTMNGFIRSLVLLCSGIRAEQKEGNECRRSIFLIFIYVYLRNHLLNCIFDV